MDSPERIVTSKCSAITGIDHVKLFVQHCICMKKRREDKKTCNQKSPKHPEDVIAGSWQSEDTWLHPVTEQTVLGNTLGCATKGTAHLPDPGALCIPSSSSPTLEMSYVCSIIFKRMKPKIFISKMQMVWFCLAMPDAKAVKRPRGSRFITQSPPVLPGRTFNWQTTTTMQALPCYRDFNLDAIACFVRSNSPENWLGRKITLENELHFVLFLLLKTHQDISNWNCDQLLPLKQDDFRESKHQMISVVRPVPSRTWGS